MRKLIAVNQESFERHQLTNWSNDSAGEIENKLITLSITINARFVNFRQLISSFEDFSKIVGQMNVTIFFILVAVISSLFK